MQKISLNILNRYEQNGLIVKNQHPHLPISIYNYSRECQYQKKWDHVTLSCRGLVVHEDGGIVARPFKKFFNLEEMSDVPNEEFEVFEKMDGSLIIAFHIYGSWVFASKGSFISDQAKAASRLFYQNYTGKGMNTDTTYLFEFTAPWNRIVVDYGQEEKITLLGAIRTGDGSESPDWHLKLVSDLNGFDVVKKYNGISDYKELKNIIGENQEGFIVRFKSGERMKIKGEEYVRLHRILTNFSNVDIWEILKSGGNFKNFLESVPDEFDVWVKEWIENIKAHYDSIEKEALGLYSKFKSETEGREYNRKEYAEWVNSQSEICKPILFRLEVGKDYSGYIWKTIRPEYQKPFWKTLED
jgi:RNA ligase